LLNQYHIHTDVLSQSDLMTREKSLVEILDSLRFLYHDLNSLIASYDTIRVEFKDMFEWSCPKGTDHKLRNITHDNQYLYINCCKQRKIYRYYSEGTLKGTLPITEKIYAMDLNNNQFYFLGYDKVLIFEMKTNFLMDWKLPLEKGKPVGGMAIKVDEKKVYFTPWQITNYIYLYSKTGTFIRTFGSKEKSKKQGEFSCPCGLTIGKTRLYICDKENNRIQVLDKDGNFIAQWQDEAKDPLITLTSPRTIFYYDKLYYVGDAYSIRVFNRSGRRLQRFGPEGNGEGGFKEVTGLCMVNAKLYVVDQGNARIQVWS